MSEAPESIYLFTQHRDLNKNNMGHGKDSIKTEQYISGVVQT